MGGGGVQSSQHSCNEQIVTLHGEGYTKKDIAAKLRCPKTVNAIFVESL